MNTEGGLLKKLQAYFRDGGWFLFGCIVFAGAKLVGMWREHAAAVAKGFIRPQDRFQMLVDVGDLLLYFFLFWILFVAIKMIPPSRSKDIMYSLALWSFLLTVVWYFARGYMLVPSTL
ncbi:MAG: hypothetical protein L0H70_00060 [Xanthomonadales bacterium]|nr:hypothetical protein [Xanthomonadales bacterium]